ncbi:hypothetical protein CBM2598_U10021 [Cupriavidus taiwanensis]|uniref:Uncharacterized protein n=1 Tax=Cupriavidus taiwanensis TaxID=164546 RepID=A0A7Z7JFB1_9BURK|nr:hypothetical protein CBM2597_U10020 [Cupriavidus taiwanensis]SOZ96194.1 hypothetical protein CBM2598_U10021 [Cupriavidus taiwanensis]SPC25525.1 hypothetical protein CBM2594_U10026 [Cupriavidus taiwanensis]
MPSGIENGSLQSSQIRLTLLLGLFKKERPALIPLGSNSSVPYQELLGLSAEEEYQSIALSGTPHFIKASFEFQVGGIVAGFR